MPDEFLIRMANVTDVDQICQLYVELNPDDQPANKTEAIKQLENLQLFEGSGILIGTLNDQVIASCTLVVIPNLTRQGRPYALLENVITSRAFRGNGFGKQLIRWAVDEAWRYDCYKVMLLTGSKDPHTLKFYSDCGFVQNKTGFQVRNGIAANDRTNN
ncbi:MAG: GNAT family N-acetyltransferase [Pseudomonadota bacterium]